VTRDTSAGLQLRTGAALVAVVAAGGLYFAFRPQEGMVDGWFSFVEQSGHHWWYMVVTWLRYPVVVVAGSLLAAAVCFRRDRPRFWACLFGPPVALATCELVIKPLVGRTLGGVYSYPSGSTVGAAALATVAVLATPIRWRTIAVVVVSLYTLWMAVAVVGLQWHYPTDSLAGVVYGVGVVLVADGLAWKVAVRLRDGSSPAVGPVGSRSAPPGG
jgi:membrane-associated phospholipid phosphatase